MRSTAKILFVLLYFTITCFIDAQITIDGTVTDHDLNPISNALVEIIDEADTSNRYSDYTDASGNFTILNITGIPSISTTPPTNHIILRNYPNPFNPSTVIYFELPKAEKIEIKIYDILGRVVRLLHNNYHKAGTYQIIWDGRNNFGSGVSAGIYFCRLKTEDQFKVHKMVLLDGGPKAASISSTTAKKSDYQKLPKIDSEFNFTIRASGDQISTTELSHIVCYGDTTIILTVPKILKTVIVGVMGGEVELNNFSMIIPEGAFNSNTELRIFEAINDEVDDSSSASKIFGVEGIPDNFAKPIDISIIPEKELIDDSFITVGLDYEIPITNTSEVVYKFMDTQDTLGVLTCKLFPDSTLIASNLAKIIASDYKQHKIYFTSKTGFSSDYSQNKHFRMFAKFGIYFKNYSDFGDLGNILEWSYDAIKAAGFDMTNINWPIEVYVKKLKPELAKRRCTHYPTYGLKNVSLLIDECTWQLVSTISLREIALGLFSSYDKDFFLPNEFTGKVNPDRYWFHHAVASWLEEKMHSDPSYYPIDYYRYLDVDEHGSGDNRLAPFSGMRAGAGSGSLSALKHGGGMSSFIKYIDMNYGEGPIVNIYELIKESRIHPIEAVKKSLSDPYIWWPDYLEELMESKLYKFDKDEAFEYYDEGSYVSTVHKGYEFKDKNDTLKLFENVKFPSLSAKSFYIGWNSSDIDLSRTMNISLKENTNSLIIYGYNVNNEENYSLLGKGQLFSKNIGELLNEGITNIIVVVTNAENEPPYTNTSNISLEVWLKSEKVLLYKFCNIRTQVQAVFEFDRIPTLPDDNLPTTNTGSKHLSWSTRGSFTGNVFDGIIRTDGESWPLIGDIKLTIDSDFNIISFELAGVGVKVIEGEDINYESEISGANISLTNITGNSIKYEIHGVNVCNYLTNVYYYYESPWTSTPGVRSYSKIIDYSCVEGGYSPSYLVIELIIN